MRLLLITDFYYHARGRDYYLEDLALGCALREYFYLTTTHIKDLNLNDDWMDIVLVRNTGPLITHKEELHNLKKHCKKPISNDLHGKGDIIGKSHLLELYQAGYPVIPSFESLDTLVNFHNLPQKFLLKPKNGCDSNGVQIVEYDKLVNLDTAGCMIQPLIAFAYEISFYFIDSEFQYALYAPNPAVRWAMEVFHPSTADIEFANKFIAWNTCKRGIQRVDACRLQDGSLLLMELEDYNPYLSLDRLSDAQRSEFIAALSKSLLAQMESSYNY